MNQSENNILKIGIALETILGLLAYLWIEYREITVEALPFFDSLLYACVFILTLLLINCGIIDLLASKFDYSQYLEFKDKFIAPLCNSLTLKGALLLSIFAGIAEELFFRAALEGELRMHLGATASCLIASIIFAAVHFGGEIKRFWSVFLLYTCAGLFLSYITFNGYGLTTAILTHAGYNFIAILVMKAQIKKEISL